VRVGSLFSGVGGLELGLEWAGMTTAWQVESNPYAQKVLAKHWPEVPRYDDIKQFSAAHAPSVDLVCGGFPCQPHSVAGKRSASGDERDLWGEMRRVICEAKPRWVVAENVTGLLSSEAGQYFGRVLRDLAQVGYDASWFVLPAGDIGASHYRERLFIVAHANGKRCEERDVPTVPREQRQHTRRTDKGGPSWPSESGVGRTLDGVPYRVDRLRCLGNAVVPQVAYVIGKAILQCEEKQ
jgi:DNA (cytosine-5)-methyltransferase 1